MLTLENRVAGLRAGIVIVQGVRVETAPPALEQELTDLIAARAQSTVQPPSVQSGVRDLLRSGGYKPSGRGKPASEYLAGAAREGRFPRINNLVDINNLASLDSGLPISLLDLAPFAGRLLLRYGAAGERYVFNAAGQDIDIAGLIVACGGEPAPEGTPLGNPVKDSLAGKIKDTTRDVVFVAYAPAAAEFAPILERTITLLADRTRAHVEGCTIVQATALPA